MEMISCFREAETHTAKVFIHQYLCTGEMCALDTEYLWMNLEKKVTIWFAQFNNQENILLTYFDRLG